MSFRTIAAGAGMLAALTLATTSSAPAGTTDSAPAAAGVHARAAKPQHRVAKSQREAAKPRHGKRARLALARHRHRPAAEPVDETFGQTAAPVRPETSAVSHQQTSAARRFREFLNPQSFAIAVSEELRSPRLLAAHFSGEMANPEIVLASLTAPVAADPHEDTTPIVAHDQTSGDDNPSTAAALTHGDATQIQHVAQADKEPARMSFLRWFFVAWGGVLTFASAVRMAVG